MSAYSNSSYSADEIEFVPLGSAEQPLGPRDAKGFSRPHVYARSVHSGSGNCVCGTSLGDRIHTEAAPGVPIPEEMRW